MDVHQARQVAVDELVAQGGHRIVAEFAADAQQGRCLVGNARAVVRQVILGQPLVFHAGQDGVFFVEVVSAYGFHGNHMVAAGLLKSQSAADVLGSVARSQQGGKRTGRVISGIQHPEGNLNIGGSHS